MDRLPKLILLHGWGADARIWLPLMQSGGIEAEAWDLPGFGSASEHSEQLDEFLCKSLARLPERCVLVGWSLGGMLACRLAGLAGDKVKGVVTLAANAAFVQTPSWPWAMPPSTFAQFQRGFRQQPQKTFQRFCALQAQGEPSPRAIINHLRSFAPVGEQVLPWDTTLGWLETLNNERVLTELAVPQLHIFARGDALVPAAAAAAFGRFPRARVEVIEHCGHCLPLSQPRQLAGKITAFVRGFQPIDKQQIASSFSRSAPRYERSAHIQKRLAKELISHIAEPLRGTWLDLGCGTGSLQGLISPVMQPDCWLFGDLAEGMLAYLRQQQPRAKAICLDAEALPLAGNSLDGVISNLALQWCHDPRRVFEEVFASLRGGGTFIANTLLDGTLFELENAWREVDAYNHVNRFGQGDELRRLLLGAGFELVDCTTKREIDWHPDFMAVLHSLKNIGANNMNSGRAPGLNTRQRLAQLAQAYEKFRAPDGKWPATYVVMTFKVRKP